MTTAWTGVVTPGRYEIDKLNWQDIASFTAVFGVDIASMSDDSTDWTEETYL